ncbi:MAG: LPS-assembly protein LptD [Leptothrix sp. (in: Bacteria)]|nr:LPS-assembly protein LptD [Leptothrix sp. (in: b-proteobacteria)]
MRITPLALAAGLLAGAAAVRAQPAAASVAASAPALQPSRSLQPLPRGESSRQLPAVLQADRLRSQPDLETLAEGHVEFRRGNTVVKADRLAYDAAQDLATASGSVSITRGAARYTGPQLQLQVQRFEGFFLEPRFEFFELGAGGRAERLDFLDSARSRATRAEYTSCPRDGPEEPAWLLRTDSVSLDLERNEGLAEGAVLRFLGVPILALPALSFPLSDARKSGWLPPSFNTDNRSGIELSMPWYWNIAPQRDATLTPRVITRRGFGLDSEFRYLQPAYEGAVALDWLPDDRLAKRSREALQWSQLGQFGSGTRYRAELVRVSDDEWWKDFPNAGRSLTPRLLPLRLAVEHPFTAARGEGLFYARALKWQVLQGSDQIVVSPYERTPQVGMRLGGERSGWQYAVQTEYNRFTLPGGTEARAGRVDGERLHLLGHVSHPWRQPGGWLVPRMSLNAAAYRQQGQQAQRVIPTFSLDAGLELERPARAFGRELRQTLEPRLLYVRTPYRAQSQLPNYDAAAKDFNFISIYTDNQFSGVDRVNDANQLTAGVTTRFVDSRSGAEMLRLGLVQRVLFRGQRVTANADGTVDGAPLEQRLSDALLLGSTSVFPAWTLDAAMQYSTDLRRSVRSIIGARYAPGPFRTLSATYRLARGRNEQVELGWQWPIYGAASATRSAGSTQRDDNSCRGRWYSVGRVNYSLKDSRITDSVLGLEYDAGCWIGRFVAERLSTGRSEATTRLMLQLELVGLSRLGSNPLRVLKDNIPGYRLLREERGGASPAADRPPAPVYD